MRPADRTLSQELSMADADLCYLSAHEAIELFRSRKLSPVELMEATIRRAEALKAPLNALTPILTRRWIAPARRRRNMRRVRGPACWKACPSASRTRATLPASRPPSAR